MKSYNFGQFIGSSSYGSRALETEGRLLSREDYFRIFESYHADQMRAIDNGTPIHSQNMVNALVMEWIITQFPHIPYWYSLREFKHDDGSTVYSSLWNGLRVGLSVPDSQTMVEAGTSSCRVYKNGSNGWTPLKFAIDGEKWEQFWDLAKKERSGEVSVGHTDKPSLEWLKLELVAGGALTQLDADEAFYFATGQARDIGGIGGFLRYKIDVDDYVEDVEKDGFDDEDFI